MMQIQKFFITALLVIAVFTSLQAQPVKKSREQKKHLSSYEDKTLSPNDNPNLLPYNRYISPAGTQIYFGNPEQENHALDVALSPDEKWIAVEGRYEVVVISTETGKMVDNLSMKGMIKDQNIMNTFSGISWLQEGNQYKLFWGAVGNKQYSYVLTASWDGKKITGADLYSFELVKPAETALPNEVLIQKEDGKNYLYVVLNGNNTVVKLDIATKEKIWTSQVGIAPFGITKANGKIYVTNWAGAVPDSSDPDVAGVPWGSAKVDPVNGSTREGTVSVLDPKTGIVLKEFTVGLHPNDIVASANEKHVFVANANSDFVNSISTQTDEITETISVRLKAEDNPFWGDSPNGLGLSKDGQILYVANGMDNALAVIELGKKSGGNTTEINSEIEGFIPTGAYPGAVAVTSNNQIFVANIEAEGANIPSESKGPTKRSYNSHKQMASVSIIQVPNDKQLKAYTKKVEEYNQLFRLALLEKMPRKNAKPVCVPERIGEPSVFKHVLYIIKENRTYDQILGDMKKGDGDSTLTIFISPKIWS